MSLDSDLEWAYAQTEDTVSVTFGAFSTRGYKDEFDQELENVGNERRVLLQVRAGSIGTFESIAYQSAIIVAGKNYKVKDKQVINDGKEFRLYLVEA